MTWAGCAVVRQLDYTAVQQCAI